MVGDSLVPDGVCGPRDRGRDRPRARPRGGDGLESPLLSWSAESGPTAAPTEAEGSATPAPPLHVP